MIFEEAFMLELGLAVRRAMICREVGPLVKLDATSVDEYVRALPFTLTVAQQRALSEIVEDLSGPHPMHRLLQGDVGSGKTAVAVGALFYIVKAGWQGAVMAPTEILAEQHYRTMTPWLKKLGIPVAMLTGSTRKGERRHILDALANGELPLIVGTHALIEEQVLFAKLGLAVIDEQHRFGVTQRLALIGKGKVSPHTLVLSATPIPRTLAMTYYGDLAVSILDMMPPGRQPILTRCYDEKDRARLYAGMRKELERGRQVYVVYPLVEESEKIDLRDATDMAEQLKNEFAPHFVVGLLHGRMNSEAKEKIMSAFSSGKIDVLVATTVIEVGVDVPNATVMVVEHAERFGLAQLHQLRGRVGRGVHRSYCILMRGKRSSSEARARLAILASTDDGFKVAEEDLKLRGPGELMGTRQSGIPILRVVRLVEDDAIINEARAAAFSEIEADPMLNNNPQLWESLMRTWGDRLQLTQSG